MGSDVNLFTAGGTNRPGHGPASRKLILLVGAALLVAPVLGFFPGQAQAQEDEGDPTGEVDPDPTDAGDDEEPLAEEGEEAPADQALDGQLRYRDEDGVRQPVVGAEMSVEGVGFPFLDTVVTDDEGRYRIGLPEPGTYEVSADAASLPEGVELLDAEQESLTVTVGEGEERPVLIRLTAGFEATGTGTLDRVLNLTAEGIRFGMILAMCSVGLSLIFGTTGLVNFAHGEMVTFGALMAYFFNQIYGLQLLVAGVLAVMVTGLMGGGFNRVVWRPMRDRGVGTLGMVIASIGLGLLIRYVFLYQFRGAQRSYAEYTYQRNRYEIGPFSLLPRDVAIIILSAIVLVAVGSALQWTRAGKAIRAVADDRDLAESSGVNVERVVALVWVAGASLAAVGGIFQGLSNQVSWHMGEKLLLLMFASVILGGIGTAYGALAGGVVIGLFFQLAVLVVPAELRLAAALFILIMVLMLRPQGILGYAERVG